MIQKIPSMGDNELTILYQNCLREITNATPQVASAQLIVDAINDEWNKRLRAASAGGYKAETPAIGVLSTVGYHVGHQGETRVRRRKLLDYVFTSTLPPVGSPAHMLEWGTPKSRERYRKLHRVLSTFLTAGSNDAKLGLACAHWEDDLRYIEETWAPSLG